MARFPSIDTNGNFESPQVQEHIKSLITSEDAGITVDTTVGTRVFVGDTMIYGDTGWRDISDRATPPEGFTFSEDYPPRIRRVNDRVMLEMSFSAQNVPSRAYILGLASGWADRRGLTLGVDISGTSAFTFTRNGMDLRTNTAQLDVTNVNVTYTWTTSDDWPNTLFGADGNR